MAHASLHIPLRFLRGHYGRTTLTVIAVALGVGLVCALDLVTRSMQRAFDEVIDNLAGRTALEVSAGESGVVPETLASQLQRLPGVDIAVPIVHGTAFLADGSGEALTVHGVDVLNEDALRVYEAREPGGQTVDDPVRFMADPRSVILTRAFAARRGLDENDTLELDTPRGRRRFRILRLLEPTGVGRVHGGNLIVMDVAAAQELFTEPEFVSRIDVVVDRSTDVASVRAAIERTLPPGLVVSTPAQRKLDLHAVMRSFGTLLRAIGLLGVLIAYLIAFNALSSGFERRRWQLGVLAAIGAPPRAIWLSQMQEALLLAGVSVGLGLGVGMLLAWILLPIIAATTALNFNLVAPQTSLVPSPISFALATTLGVGVTLLAAWLPAARAVRAGVAMTIRGRGREADRTELRPGWAMAAGLWSAAGAAVVLQSLAGEVGFGLLATALIAAAIAASAPPLIPFAARVALPALVASAGSSGRLAAMGLRDHGRRVGITTAMLAVGLGVVVWLGVLARSFETSVVDTLGRAIRADVVVTSANIGSGFLEAPLDGELVAAVRGMPGIEDAAGWRALEWPYGGEAIGLSAYDPQYFRNRRFGEWPLEEAAAGNVWEEVALGRGVVVSTSFVASFGRGVGTRMVLDTPTGPLKVPIVGVTVDFVSPKGTVELSRELFIERWRDRTITRIFALKRPDTETADLRRRIASEIGATYRLRILSARELLDYFVIQVRRAFSVIPVFAAAIYVVILIGLASSLITSVLDRQRELAIVQVIGLRRRLARRVVVLESLVVGVVGLVLAAVGGLALSALWVGRTFQLLLGWTLHLSVPAAHLALVAGAGVLVCVVASVIPARRVGHLGVSEALRHES
ncbi:MAG: ABC transporter permease [bacterium]|nr:ABC transporter permease [bacterium]